VQRPEHGGERHGDEADADAQLPRAHEVGQAAGERARAERRPDVRARARRPAGDDAVAGHHVQRGLAVVERVVQHVLRIAAQHLRRAPRGDSALRQLDAVTHRSDLAPADRLDGHAVGHGQLLADDAQVPTAAQCALEAGGGQAGTAGREAQRAVDQLELHRTPPEPYGHRVAQRRAQPVPVGELVRLGHRALRVLRGIAQRGKGTQRGDLRDVHDDVERDGRRLHPDPDMRVDREVAERMRCCRARGPDQDDRAPADEGQPPEATGPPAAGQCRVIRR
jgi:hypothetical protein